MPEISESANKLKPCGHPRAHCHCGYETNNNICVWCGVRLSLSAVTKRVGSKCPDA